MSATSDTRSKAEGHAKTDEPPSMDHGRSEGRLMYEESIDHFADFAQGKVSALKHNPVGFFVGAMMAGAYVGFGIILIFILGGAADPQSKKLGNNHCDEVGGRHGLRKATGNRESHGCGRNHEIRSTR